MLAVQERQPNANDLTEQRQAEGDLLLNPCGAKALRDDWKAPRSSKPTPKQRKVQPVTQELAKELSDEEWNQKRAALAEVKMALK